MRRSLYKELLKWKNSASRKPLILQGARQVGKTWLMQEFARNEFEEVAYLNFESSARLHQPIGQRQPEICVWSNPNSCKSSSPQSPSAAP
jgi:predicted AAA+ superfamily ATPase